MQEKEYNVFHKEVNNGLILIWVISLAKTVRSTGVLKRVHCTMLCEKLNVLLVIIKAR